MSMLCFTWTTVSICFESKRCMRTPPHTNNYPSQKALRYLLLCIKFKRKQKHMKSSNTKTSNQQNIDADTDKQSQKLRSSHLTVTATKHQTCLDSTGRDPNSNPFHLGSSATDSSHTRHDRLEGESGVWMRDDRLW